MRLAKRFSNGFLYQFTTGTLSEKGLPSTP
jgi:hypothetical protein